MSGVKINTEFAQSTLRALQAALRDMTPAMEDIGDDLVASTKERFPKGLSPDGVRWAPKSQTTIDAYQKKSKRVDARPLSAHMCGLDPTHCWECREEWLAIKPPKKPPSMS